MKKKKIGSYKVPFDSNGNQLHYAPYRQWDYANNRPVGPDYDRPNEPFEDTLVFSTYSRGRSAAYFHMTRESTGTDVIVFMTDLCEMIPHMVGGKITGRFQHIQRGANFGTTLLEIK